MYLYKMKDHCDAQTTERKSIYGLYQIIMVSCINFRATIKVLITAFIFFLLIIKIIIKSSSSYQYRS